MRYRIRRKNHQLHIVTTFSKKEILDEGELSVLEQSAVDGLFQVRQEKKNRLAFTGPLGISLEERLKKPITRYDFFFLIEQAVDLFLRLPQNGLLPGHLVCDMKQVYLHEATKELRFLYLPIQGKDVGANLASFLNGILYSAIPGPGADTDFISKFAYFLKGMPVFSAEETEQYILREEEKIASFIRRDRTGFSVTGVVPEREGNPGNKTRMLSVEEAQWQEGEAGTGTFLLFRHAENQSGQRTGQQGLTLRRTSTGEEVPVDNVRFRIGRDPANADYCISDNKRVGRTHAEILSGDGRYFVMDLDSLNHTFLNGNSIPARTRTVLSDGDTLSFADEEFTVRLT